MPEKPMACLIAASLASVLLVQPGSGQSREARVASLADQAIAVRTIDPADTDFTDLEPLRDVLASVRVVLLGEQTHADGATFLAKSRLVKFLHQEMGFDVLAFESGFYDCEKAESRLQLGEPARSAIARCVFPLWTGSAEVQPTIDYLGATRTSSRPLRLAGFDSQLTGSASADHLAEELREVSDEIGSAFDWASFGDVLGSLIRPDNRTGRRALPDEAVQQALDDALAGFAAEIAASSLHDGEFWTQVVNSLRSDLLARYASGGGRSTPSALNIRDRQMAENLLWLLEHDLTGRKVIVWAATVHNARGLGGIDDAPDEATELYAEWRPMGSHLSERLGSEMYSVAFIAQEGEWGFPMMARMALEPGEPEMLESLLTDAGFDYGLVDLRELGPQIQWLRERVWSRPFGYQPMAAVWGDVVDAFFFTRVMSPSNPVIP